MCRLFGQISAAAACPRDFLVDSERSLLRQSDFRNDRLQKDGWGIGHFDARGPRISKSPAPVFREKERFTACAARLRSRIVVAHIRAASNPRGLKQSKLLGLANTQPFMADGFLFAHNGTLEIPDEVAKFLGAYRRKILGFNDSEVYFWQFRKFLDAYGDIPQALQACVREIWAIWEGCKKRYPRKKRPYTGLNALVSDGKSLHGICHYPLPGAGSLFNPRQPWGAMSWARRKNRILIASEPMDSKPWQRIGDGEILSAALRNGKWDVRKIRFRAIA